MEQANAAHPADALAAAIADWRASKPGQGDRDHFNREYLGEYAQELDACARHGVDPDLLNQEGAGEGVSLLGEPDEAEAQHCERLAARHEADNPELAGDLLRSADLARHPGKRCRPGKRVQTDQGRCRVEEGGTLTPLERPEDVRRRREMLAGWEVAARESDRRIAAEDAIAGKRQGTFAPAARRTPAARPAARRPRTSGKRSTTRGSPDDDSGSGEPPGDLAGGLSDEDLSGPSPRFSRPWRPALERTIAERLRALREARP